MAEGPTKRRPSSLDLRYVKFPVGSIVSIAHRISGVALVFAIPALLYGLQNATSGPEGFEATVQFLDRRIVQSVCVLAVVFLVHHWLAGIRHLLLDLHIGIDKRTARYSGWLVLVLVAITALAMVKWTI